MALNKKVVQVDKATVTRFFKYVEVSEECWRWIGCHNNQGYGSFRSNGISLGSHRYSWILHNGQTEDDLHVLHLCNNKWCVRPDHLYLGTNLDNAQDMLHAKLKGPNKLTVTEVRGIKGALKFTKLSRTKLAKMFDVSRSTLDHIAEGYTWANIVI